MANLGNTTRPAYVYDAETDTWLPIGVGAHSHDYTTQFIGKTLVDAKGDIVTASASDTPAILSKGADGTILVADSTTSTGLAWQPYGAPVTSGKNAIINGGMDVWQRGVTFGSQAGLGAPAFTADRMHVYRQSGASGVTTTRQPAGLAGFQYCMRIQRNSGDTATNNIVLRHTIETADSIRFAGQTATFSFYARSGANFSSSANNLTVNFAYGTGVDQPVYSFTNWTFVNGVATNCSLTTTWQRFTVTGLVPSTATQVGFEMYSLPSGTAGANDYIEITGMQLEQGSSPTPFSRAGGTIQGELAACQRYYQIFTGGSSNTYIASGGQAGSSVDLYVPVKLTTTMRISPTSIEYSGLRWQIISNNGSISSAVISDANPNLCLIRCTSTGLTSTTQPYMLITSTGAGYLAFGAEL